MIMKKLLYMLPILIGAMMMVSCEKQVEIDPALLVGRWAAPSSYNSSKNLVFVFLDEACVIGGKNYGKWGYQFDEGNEVSESDVKADYHKNGWFGWTAGTSKISLIHMTSMEVPETDETGALIYTPNKVTAFDGQTMTMVDEGITYKFKKIGDK